MTIEQAQNRLAELEPQEAVAWATYKHAMESAQAKYDAATTAIMAQYRKEIDGADNSRNNWMKFRAEAESLRHFIKVSQQ